MNKEDNMNKEIIDLMEKRLDEILPDNWEDRFETHEERMELFDRSFEKAESIARQAIKMLRNECV